MKEVNEILSGERELSRRKVLKAGSAGIGAALAGCSGEGSSQTGETPTSTTTSSTVEDTSGGTQVDASENTTESQGTGSEIKDPQQNKEGNVQTYLTKTRGYWIEIENPDQNLAVSSTGARSPGEIDENQFYGYENLMAGLQQLGVSDAVTFFFGFGELEPEDGLEGQGRGTEIYYKLTDSEGLKAGNGNGYPLTHLEEGVVERFFDENVDGFADRSEENRWDQQLLEYARN